MLKPNKSYAGALKAFRWQIPERYNMGVDVCDKFADITPNAPALIDVLEDGSPRPYSYLELKRLSNRLANALLANGLSAGDRVGILLPQCPETALTHIACYKAGLIAVPLFTLFGEDALEYRLANSGTAAIVTDRENLPKIDAIKGRLNDLGLILSVDGAETGVHDFHALLSSASDTFTPVDSLAEDPALLIFTSGTTGPPKGALHAHRTLLGHFPGVQFMHDFFPKAGDRFWTPADWAWAGGLLDVLLPSLALGKSVLIYRGRKFDPEDTYRLLADHEVRNSFLPPTALKLMRQVERPRERWNFALRSIFTGGEAMGAELMDWGRDTFGFTINEGYGQTECNLVVGNCATIMAARPGSMGKPVPGHDVAIIDENGDVLPAGVTGSIAVRSPNPVMFLGYWNNPEATADKYLGDWLLTGDIGQTDEDGYIWFVGRDDDVITSAGYRIGPGEIEDCLMSHPAVLLAAAIGKPDPIRTEIVKAFIVANDGVEPNAALTEEIRAHVRNRLSAHEYPREIEFVDDLPMTTTGKIMRRELRARETP
jgi:acetyl-CoA synthetase